MLDRAQVLDANAFAQPVNPGELTIPAVRGVGGGVLYFLDKGENLGQVWGVEFEPVGRDGTSAGLTHIDHVAQTMNYDEMLTWILFYRSIFAVDKGPMVDVIDPAGLVRSQVIASRDGAFRLTINGAENHRTLAGRFIADTFGSGLQHIAFASSDIFAAAETLAGNGLATLAISDNYYADLEARLGMEPALLARLQQFNILYDQDESGDFFQLYVPGLTEGFFFEVVQRRGSYAGYGAVNAPFRIAALKRTMRPANIPRH